MFKSPVIFSNQLHKISLLLGVYALHLFLFIGLTVFSAPSYAGAGKINVPAGNNSKQHDPASVECRSLFKYEDSKQQLHLDDFPIITVPVLSNPQSSSSVISAGIPAFPSHALSDVSIKRYRLLGVFLI
jgi:hypothetical protein